MDPVMLSKSIHPEDIEKSILQKFEGIQLPIPSGYDRFLKGEYGDYMKLPPIDERESHYAMVEIDKNIYDMEDYESYI
jgi:lipopolysaccharide cholinephosphotransferase